MTELSAEIYQTLKDQDEDFINLEEDILDVNLLLPGAEFDEKKERFDVHMKKAQQEFKSYVLLRNLMAFSNFVRYLKCPVDARWLTGKHNCLQSATSRLPNSKSANSSSCRIRNLRPRLHRQYRANSAAAIDSPRYPRRKRLSMPAAT